MVGSTGSRGDHALRAEPVGRVAQRLGDGAEFDAKFALTLGVKEPVHVAQRRRECRHARQITLDNLQLPGCHTARHARELQLGFRARPSQRPGGEPAVQQLPHQVVAEEAGRTSHEDLRRFHWYTLERRRTGIK